ncbi:hypothetical protein, variant 2 [Aphanomyces astaci]|uniref:EF-hand domain-containing protein n=1 Tax=Aphanomyces astaci TaxID=112090 RepID=W4H827_APHAT|nr:hypothetical protein, variant 2 [Aphanomyces astaci]ETV88175.1 hypothetical protein, variant 2 [Aphanomyces astaci]|eukprot:XP_009823041.1 hypothetical protein, variant 2 [Aphanomyces astaci]
MRSPSSSPQRSRDHPSAWLARVQERHPSITHAQLLRQLRGSYHGSQVPWDQLALALAYIEPQSQLHDPLDASMKAFWMRFMEDDDHVNVDAALTSIWPKGSGATMTKTRPPPLHTTRDSEPTSHNADDGERSRHDIVHALGAYGVAALEDSLRHTARIRIPDLFDRVVDSAPHWDMGAEAFYEFCQPFCDPTAPDMVRTRQFLVAMQLPWGALDPAVQRLRDALQHLSADELETQCAMFDMEDDGWILLSECVSVLHALPNVALTQLEIEAGVRQLSQPDLRVAYKDVCAVLGSASTEGTSHSYDSRWQTLRHQLCHDDAAKGQVVFHQLERIFSKLSTHPSRCLVTASDLQRVLGTLLTPSDLQWIHRVLAKSDGHVDGHDLLTRLFPASFLASSTGTFLERSQHAPVYPFRSSTPRCRLESTPYDGTYTAAKRAHSTSPSRSHPSKLISPHVTRSTKLQPHRHPSPHSPSKTTPQDDAVLQQLREIIQYRQIDLLTLSDVSDAAGLVPLDNATAVLWRELEALELITFVQLQRALRRFATGKHNRLNLKSILDGLFDWSRLRNVTTHSIEDMAETFARFTTSRRGYLRWHPDFQRALGEMFPVDWMPWEHQVMCHRFGVTMHHEMWIDVGAFVRHLAGVPQDLWPLVVAHCDFQEMDPTHKGYVDRADLKRFLQRVLQRTPTPHQVGQVWQVFLQGDPTATVRRF